MISISRFICTYHLLCKCSHISSGCGFVITDCTSRVATTYGHGRGAVRFLFYFKDLNLSPLRDVRLEEIYVYQQQRMEGCANKRINNEYETVPWAGARRNGMVEEMRAPQAAEKPLPLLQLSAISLTTKNATALYSREVHVSQPCPEQFTCQVSDCLRGKVDETHANPDTERRTLK